MELKLEEENHSQHRPPSIGIGSFLLYISTFNSDNLQCSYKHSIIALRQIIKTAWWLTAIWLRPASRTVRVEEVKYLNAKSRLSLKTESVKKTIDKQIYWELNLPNSNQQFCSPQKYIKVHVTLNKGNRSLKLMLSFQNNSPHLSQRKTQYQLAACANNALVMCWLLYVCNGTCLRGSFEAKVTVRLQERPDKVHAWKQKLVFLLVPTLLLHVQLLVCTLYLAIFLYHLSLYLKLEM